jgi:hypothetical protein
MQAIAEKRKQE